MRNPAIYDTNPQMTVDDITLLQTRPSTWGDGGPLEGIGPNEVGTTERKGFYFCGPPEQYKQNAPDNMPADWSSENPFTSPFQEKSEETGEGE